MYTIKMSERKKVQLNSPTTSCKINHFLSEFESSFFFSLDIIMIFFEMSQKYFDNINDILYK